MIQVIVEKKSAFIFTEARIKNLVTIAARVNKKIKGIVEIKIITEKSMRQLNRRYRGINKPTDVLSFAWDEVTEPKSIKRGYLGQLCVCPHYIKKQAKRFEVSVPEESARSLVHGLLHVAGYDHVTVAGAKTMFAYQEKIIDLFLKAKV